MRHAAIAGSAVPSSRTGVTTSAGRSPAVRPRTSLATTSWRPRMSVAVPPCTGSLLPETSAGAGSPGIRQASAGGAILTRDGGAIPSHGATSRAADTTKLFGASTS